MTNKKTSVGILGGGITGLSCAYALSKKNIPVTIYERSEKLGGAISTVKDGKWLVEEGPNTLMINSGAHWKLFEELGIPDDITVAGKVSKKRFIVKNGDLTPLPMGFGNFIKTPLLSAKAKFRLLKEPFTPASTKHDESIAIFIKRRLGEEVLDYAVNPFVSGIYAGDPKALSVKHTFNTLWEMEQKHGSLLKGAFRREKNSDKSRRALLSFKNGIQHLVHALSKKVNGQINLNTTVRNVRKNDCEWIINAEKEDHLIENRHNCLVSNIPAYTMDEIFPGDRFKDLSDVPYAPMQVLAFGFRKNQISHPLDGFGMLVPEVENRDFLGCLFSSSLFDGRAPEGHHLLTCFIGGARQPNMAKKPIDELSELILKDLDDLIGISGEPQFIHHKFWGKAIPQYEVGYDYFLSLIKEIEEHNPGLYLNGNYRGGVSVPDCISSGFETAQKAESFLKTQN